MVFAVPNSALRQTAEIALQESGLALPLTIDERLRDRELGVLDLLTTRGVAARFPLEAERRRCARQVLPPAPPARSRGWTWPCGVPSFLRDLNDLPPPPHLAATRALVVCHDALVLLFRFVCEQLSEEQVLQIGATTPVRNVSITQSVPAREDGWLLARYNDVSHLEQQAVPVTEHGGEPDARAAR